MLAILCPKDISFSSVPKLCHVEKVRLSPTYPFQTSIVVPLATTETKSLIFYYAGDSNSQILLLSHLGLGLKSVYLGERKSLRCFPKCKGFRSCTYRDPSENSTDCVFFPTYDGSHSYGSSAIGHSKHHDYKTVC